MTFNVNAASAHESTSMSFVASTSQPVSRDMRGDCEQMLRVLLDGMPSVLFASVASVDGRSVAHVNGSAQTDAPRIAAITSSLLGLIESLSRETLDSTSQYSTVATANGSMVVARVPARSRHLTFCLCVDKNDNLAMAVRATLDGAEKIAAIADATA